MVPQKRLDYGFNGYQVPAIPRATRSARKRRPFKTRGEANQMCAFDLLATVAGNLLLEKGSSVDSGKMSSEVDKSTVVENTIKEEGQDEDQSLKVEALDQGRCDNILEPLGHQGDACFGFPSVATNSDSSERLDASNLVNGKSEIEMETLPCKVEIGPGTNRESDNCNISDGDDKRLVNFELEKTSNVSVAEGAVVSQVEDPVVWNDNPPGLVSLDSSSAKVSLYGVQNPHSSFPACRDDVNLVSRDDDENSSGCTHPSTTRKLLRTIPRIGDRRIRKVRASRYWKVPPKFKNVRHSSAEENLKLSYSEINSFKRLRSERNYPFKKRRFYRHTSLPNSDGGIRRGGITHFPGKDINGGTVDLHQKINKATGESSSVADEPRLFHSRDSHVKLRIKSFRVPELFIEMPETATVGSLKRAVMDAVNAILGGGLRVGVLIQGTKVRDDNQTLLQTGISHDNKSDVLGFSLEPNISQTSQSLCIGDSPPKLICENPQPLTRCPASLGCDASPELHLPCAGNLVESDHDSAPSPTDMSIDKSITDSKALIAVPEALSAEPLAVVPTDRNSKRSEAAHRRIRRPFSVSEVEALVQAVEKLGTGRWRDVKVRAFDNAKHRTYVDLKDKWKTLVHTARISPQQRRGEPVPQELLDRVLIAHAYWSQQQSKQLKQQQETCLLL